MNFTSAELLALVQHWLWPFFRVAGLLMAAPVIGSRTVPVRIRIVLAGAITMVLAPVIPQPPVIAPFSAEAFLVTVQQVAIGLGMGFAVRLVFMVLELAGQIIGQQMGLGFAVMVDPQSGAQVPTISQLYVIVATLMFLSLNGHLLMLKVLADSFRTLPVGTGGISHAGLWHLIGWGGWLLSNAVLLALPAIAALLIINLAFGVITRAAPQLNIFAVGFPVMILLGTGVILVSMPALQPHLVRMLNEALGLARQLVTRTP